MYACILCNARAVGFVNACGTLRPVCEKHIYPKESK